MEERSLNALPLVDVDFEEYGLILGKPEKEPTVELEILRYWDSIGVLEGLRGDYSIGFLEVYRRPMIVDVLERHVKTWEALIPLEGVSIIPLAPPSKDGPDPDKVKAFILDGTAGILMYEGTWHYAPYPISPKATFLVLFRRNTPKEDLELKELRGYNLKFKITL